MTTINTQFKLPMLGNNTPANGSVCVINSWTDNRHSSIQEQDYGFKAATGTGMEKSV